MIRLVKPASVMVELCPQRAARLRSGAGDHDFVKVGVPQGSAGPGMQRGLCTRGRRGDGWAESGWARGAGQDGARQRREGCTVTPAPLTAPCCSKCWRPSHLLAVAWASGWSKLACP